LTRIVVAMSGGVDSSVAAGLLVEQGHDVIGVHMKLHDAPTVQGSGTCCGLDDALDARAVADRLGIPFYVLNLRDEFQRAVIDTFTSEWIAGRTPNPCVHCNGVLKFRVLLQRALALGASHLATGHYAQVDTSPVGLRMATDRDKDQSYFLFPVTPKALEHTLFPLGGMTKPEVRGHAERLGLPTASKSESQDVCFLPERDHARLIREAQPERDGAGEIVDEAGQVLGQHDDYARFTVGQRRGVGVAFGEPRFVLRVEPDTRRVVVGPADRLNVPTMLVGGCNWFEQPDPERVVAVRIRHRGALAAATVHAAANGQVEVRALESLRAVTPGQAAVFYDGDRVLGGGWIRKAVAA
jgi:tRNA-specific 2-thiouridylase